MKSIKKLMVIAVLLSSINSFAKTNNTETNTNTNLTTEFILESDMLKPVFDSYFNLKDALVKTDATLANTASTTLLKTLKAVKMKKLSAEEHTVWMKVMKELSADAEGISNLQDISKQRNLFSTLSLNMYQLMKVSKQETPIYFQKCPMYKNAKGEKGGNWLSKESGIKNPYFGSRMMSCGSTLETIE